MCKLEIKLKMESVATCIIVIERLYENVWHAHSDRIMWESPVEKVNSIP